MKYKKPKDMQTSSFTYGPNDLKSIINNAWTDTEQEINGKNSSRHTMGTLRRGSIKDQPNEKSTDNIVIQKKSMTTLAKSRDSSLESE